jgi:hypothetical protein
MKKPLNRFALLFFVAAAIAFTGQVAFVFLFDHAVTYEITPPPTNGFVLVVNRAAELWRMVQQGFMSSAYLLACAVLIELVDQIRWNALPRD